MIVLYSTLLLRLRIQRILKSTKMVFLRSRQQPKERLLSQWMAIGLFAILQACDANPIPSALELEKAALSCPTHQFFSYDLQACRDCATFCVKEPMESSCERQCKSYFLKKEMEDMKDDWMRKDENRDEEIAQLKEAIQVTLSCPTHQFFSHDLQACRDCATFCVKEPMESSCERQCKSYFLEKEMEKMKNDRMRKDEYRDEEMAQLREAIQNNAANGRTNHVLMIVVCVVIACVVVVVLAITECRRRKLCRRHGNVSQDLSNSDPALQKPAPTPQPVTADRGTNTSRDDNIESTLATGVQPVNDGEVEDQDIDDAQAENNSKSSASKSKCFTGSTTRLDREGALSTKQKDGNSELSENVPEESINLLEGPAAGKG